MATREELIAQLASSIANQAPMNPLLMASAFPANVSASGISGAFSPEILLASGILTPQRIAAAEQAALEQLQAQYLADVSKTIERPYEASDQYLMDVIMPYENRTDDVADYLKGAVAAMAAGQTNPESLRIKFGEANLPNLVANQAEIYNVIDTFYDRLNRNKAAQQEYNYKVQQAGVGGVGAPTAEQARVKAFESLGLGNLAGALPSPTEQYDIPSDVFVNQDRVKALEAELARASGNVMTAGSYAFPATRYANKQAEVYAAKANQEALRNAVAKAQANVVGAPDVAERAVDFATKVISPPFMPNLFGETSQEAYDRKRKEAAVAAFATEKARQAQAPKVPQMTMEQVSPTYKAAKASQTAASGGIQGETERANRLAKMLSDKLAAAGYTPYQQSVNQLINYAIATARK